MSEEIIAEQAEEIVEAPVEAEEAVEEEPVVSIYDGLSPEEAAAKKQMIEERRARIIRMRDRYNALKENVAAVCERCGRKPEEVKIVAVSKTVKSPAVQEAIMAGITDFAENRPNIHEQKAAIFPEAKWHYIGPLDIGTCRKVVPSSELVESVADLDLFGILNVRANLADTVQKILVEVNVSGEASKRGLHPRNIDGALRSISYFTNLECVGFMTMAPQGDPEAARATFRGLRELRDVYAKKYEKCPNIHLDELSMGMSEDYEIAIEEGATIIRIGRAIFDENFAK